MTDTRCILHVDMDAFYASIEQRDDPELRGKPVVVGGGTRGVVAAASYESRVFGIRSAMPMAEAKRRCPDLIRIPGRMSHYQAVSKRIFAVFREFTPVVEGLSLDEAFLDMTASRKLLGDGEWIAAEIKQRILDETRLTASVGVAENKLVAKIASDLDKPDGLVVVPADRVNRILDPLPVSVIPGIGPKTLPRLKEIGIRTVGDLRTARAARLEPIFGRYTARSQQRAAGIDARPVVAERQEKSISAEETFDEDLADRHDMENKLMQLSERTSARLRKAGLSASTVPVKIRQPDFTTVTRQAALRPPGNGTETIYAAARTLLCKWLADHPDAKVRLLGVGGIGLGPAQQGDLFAETDSPTAVDETVDAIRERFGSAAMSRASGLRRREDRDEG